MSTSLTTSLQFTFNGQRPNAKTPTLPVFKTPTPAQAMPRKRVAPPCPQARPRFATGVVVDGVSILPRVVEIAEGYGTDLTLVAQAVLDPEDTWTGKNGRSTVNLRGNLAAITANDTGEVIALASRTKALKERTEPRDGAVKHGHGGSGLAMPTSMPDVIDRLRTRGFAVARDSGHYVVRHPRYAGQVTMSKTPSDIHAIPNCVMEIRSRFGVDVRED